MPQIHKKLCYKAEFSLLVTLALALEKRDINDVCERRNKERTFNTMFMSMEFFSAERKGVRLVSLLKKQRLHIRI